MRRKPVGRRVVDGVKAAIDNWVAAAPITDGRVFRCVSRKGSVWGDGISEKVIWHVVKESAAKAGIAKLSPHDCRRRQTRTDPIPPGPRFGGDHGAIPGLQTPASASRQR